MMLNHRNRRSASVAVILTGVLWVVVGCDPQPEGPAGLDDGSPVYADARSELAKPVKPTRPVQPPREVRSVEEKIALLTEGIDAPVNRDDEPPSPPQAIQAAEEGEAYLAEGNLHQARLRLERAVALAPKNAAFRYQLGETYLQLKNYGKAMEHFMAAYRLRPDDATLQLAMGRLFETQRNNTRAGKHYQLALLCSDADPSQPEMGFALWRLAGQVEASGDNVKALDAYEVLDEWIQTHRDSYEASGLTSGMMTEMTQLPLTRSRLLMKLGHPTEAAETLAGVYEASPQSRDVIELYIQSLVRTNRAGEAIDILSQYGNHDIANEQVTPVISDLAYDAVIDDTSVAFLNRMVQLGAEHPEWLGAIAGAVDYPLIPWLDAAEARRFFGTVEAMDAGTGRGVGMYLAGVIAQRMGDVPRAATYLEGATAELVGCVEPMDRLVELWISQGRTDLALRKAESLPQEHWPRWVSPYLRGKTRLAMGDDEQAAALLTEACRLDMGNQETYLLLARAYRNIARYDDASDAMAKAAEIDPLRPGLLQDWVGMEHEAGRLSHFAAGPAARLIDQYPHELQVQLMRVSLELLKGDGGEAHDLAQRLAEQYPGDSDAQRLAVVTDLWLARQAEPATRTYRFQLVGTDRWEIEPLYENEPFDPYRNRRWDRPNGPVYITDVGVLWHLVDRMGTGEIGITYATQPRAWIRRVPEWALEDAIEALEPMLERTPDDQELKELFGAVLLGLDRRSDALALWESLYLSDPTDAYRLGGYIAALTASEEPTRGIEAIKRGAVQSPEDLAIRAELIDRLIETERYEDAIEYLEPWIASARDGSAWEVYCRRYLFDALVGSRRYVDARAVIATLAETTNNTVYFVPAGVSLALHEGNLEEASNLISGQNYLVQAPGLLLPRDAKGTRGAFCQAMSSGMLSLGFEQAQADLRQWTQPRTGSDATVAELYLSRQRHEALEDVLTNVFASLTASGNMDPAYNNQFRWYQLLVCALDNRYDDGHALLDEWISDKLELNRREYQLWKVVYYLMEARSDDAMTYAIEWQESTPQFREPYLALMFLLEREERYEELLTYLDRWETICRAAIDSEAPGKGRWEDVLNLCLYSRLSTLSTIGRFEDCAAIAETLWNQDPENMGYFFFYVSSLPEINQNAEAIVVMKEVLREHPEMTVLKNALAYALAVEGTQLRYATALIRQALEEDQQRAMYVAAGYGDYAGEVFADYESPYYMEAPMMPEASEYQANIAYLDTLGWVLYRRGKVDDAAKVFNGFLPRLKTEDYESAEVWDHIGDVLYRDGQTERAIEAWETALEQAEAETYPRWWDRMVLEKCPEKIRATEAGEIPPVMPFGEGVDDPLYPDDNETFEDDAGEDALDVEVDVEDSTPDVTTEPMVPEEE